VSEWKRGTLEPGNQLVFDHLGRRQPSPDVKDQFFLDGLV
jgi:hypothetical protein